MVHLTRNNAKTALALFFWGWPVVAVFLVAVDQILSANSFMSQSNHTLLFSAVATVPLSAVTAIIIELAGAVLMNSSWMAILTTIGPYALLILQDFRFSTVSIGQQQSELRSRFEICASGCAISFNPS